MFFLTDYADVHGSNSVKICDICGNSYFNRKAIFYLTDYTDVHGSNFCVNPCLPAGKRDICEKFLPSIGKLHFISQITRMSTDQILCKSVTSVAILNFNRNAIFYLTDCTDVHGSNSV